MIRRPPRAPLSSSSSSSEVYKRHEWNHGTLLYIHVAPKASAKMVELDEAELIEGKGIVSDRYYNETGTYSAKPDIRDVTLIENEVLVALAENQPPLQDKPIILKPV